MKVRSITEEEKAEIKRVISYCPDTGAFFNRVDRGPLKMFKAGSAINMSPNKKHGYMTIEVLGHRYLAHRLAWLLSYDEWPKEDIDHIDHCKTNNILSNLRCVTHENNMKNVPLRKNNNSGVAGVCRTGRNKNKWRATITANGKQVYLGEFKDFDKAVQVRMNAMIKHGYHENHGARRCVEAEKCST